MLVPVIPWLTMRNRAELLFPWRYSERVRSGPDSPVASKAWQMAQWFRKFRAPLYKSATEV